MKTRWFKWSISFLSTLLLSCASSPTDQQIIDLKQRIEFDGISVLPPQAKNWMLGASPLGGIIFKKQLSETLDEPESHTLLAGVRYADLAEKAPKNMQELLLFTESSHSSQNDPRLHNMRLSVHVDENRSKTLNTDCVVYEQLMKESANPLFPGKVFMLTAQGFQCRHPFYANIVIDAFCTERYLENTQTVDKAYKDECIAFLDTVRFQSPVSQTDTFKDISYLNVPAWNYPQWQQLISAAIMLNEQGNKSGAEQLCYQALHFADANMIKSLFDYADMLETQMNNHSIFIRNRANKLAKLRAQQENTTTPQTTYLGFQPTVILKEYARFLNKLQKTTDATSIEMLEEAYKYTQEVHAVRFRIMSEGGNAQGICTGFEKAH